MCHLRFAHSLPRPQDEECARGLGYRVKKKLQSCCGFHHVSNCLAPERYFSKWDPVYIYGIVGPFLSRESPNRTDDFEKPRCTRTSKCIKWYLDPTP